jgi:hypothetical protein
MREWLPAGHMAFFLSDVIDQLDISGIKANVSRHKAISYVG